MHFRSLRSFVLALAGPCLLAIVIALVVYNLIAAARTQQTVSEHTQELMESALDARLNAIADAEGERIQRELDKAMTLAHQLATTNALMGMQDSEGQRALFLSRRQLSNLVRQTLADNPDLIDVYIGWEPNAFTDDARYANNKRHGNNSDGRFMPWWFRNDDGSLSLDLLGDVEDDTRLPNGIRQAEYYMCPRETLAPCIIDPAAYDFGGVTQLVTSFNAPILVDGEFRGVAGIDLSVDFIQTLLSDANQALYNGAGRMVLVAGHGILVADTAEKGGLGEPARDVLSSPLLSGIEQATTQGSLYSSKNDGMLERYLPLHLGDTSQPWVLMLQLPEAVALAELNNLQGVLSEQRQQNTFGMTLVGLLLAALGVIALWWIGGQIARPLKRLATRMQEIATGNGDLTQRLPIMGRDESAALAEQFNAFAEKIQTILLDVRRSSEAVNRAANEITQGGHNLSRRTDQAAASLQQTSTAMEQISSTVGHTTQASQEASGLSQTASQLASRTDSAFKQVVSTMDEIRSNSDEIQNIVSVIDGIAFQTNLLALNASVEAARAGEHGRGFAVVADEVRKLAGRSSEAAKDIRQRIDTSAGKVESGTQMVHDAETAMHELADSVTRITQMLGDISTAAREQSDGISQVSIAVSDLDQMTQQNAALVEESTTAAEQLNAQADRLAALVGGFKLSEEAQELPRGALPNTTLPTGRLDAPQR